MSVTHNNNECSMEVLCHRTMEVLCHRTSIHIRSCIMSDIGSLAGPFITLSEIPPSAAAAALCPPPPHFPSTYLQSRVHVGVPPQPQLVSQLRLFTDAQLLHSISGVAAVQRSAHPRLSVHTDSLISLESLLSCLAT